MCWWCWAWLAYQTLPWWYTRYKAPHAPPDPRSGGWCCYWKRWSWAQGQPSLQTPGVHTCWVSRAIKHISHCVIDRATSLSPLVFLHGTSVLCLLWSEFLCLVLVIVSVYSLFSLFVWSCLLLLLFIPRFCQLSCTHVPQSRLCVSVLSEPEHALSLCLVTLRSISNSWHFLNASFISCFLGFPLFF